MLERAAYCLPPAPTRGPPDWEWREARLLSSLLEVAMGSKVHSGPRPHIPGAPRLWVQEKAAKLGPGTSSGRITAHPALQGQSPQLPARQKPHPGTAQSECLAGKGENCFQSVLSPHQLGFPSKGAALPLSPLGDTSPDSDKDGEC